MAEQSGERTQDATPHRRKQAREQGQVARSQDLGSAVLLVCGIGAIMMMGPMLASPMVALMRDQLGGEAWLVMDHDMAVHQWWRILAIVSWALLPLLGLFALLAFLSQLFQVGFLFLPDKVAPDLSRINVLSGFRRLFSVTSAARLGFGVFKVLIVGTVAGVSVYLDSERIMEMIALELPQLTLELIDILLWTALKVGAALLILALLDYAFQRWKLEEDIKMTTQEVREEMKNLQGDPQVAARRRAVQRQLVLNRLASAVPQADVVVTNPTELAVAIKYDAESMLAPVVVAKGAGLIAQRIRRLALEHGIPIMERKPLAQALYREVDVNHPVPSQQFAAVAEVLAYVYQLQGKTLPTPPPAA
ncbi:MAG: flagellar biosynthesis protein FlhB [Planctomycetota bacterium]|nr:MAG: flagellar biosynthesis protein FlhB [Planctomycetota bacterium]REJ94372.1 MAG: flagellar biosynthesis protein FlhB [Planctomycetota bacterium]